MSQAALLLAALSVGLGLWPLLPHASTAGLIGAAFGFLPSLGGLMLAYVGRGQALQKALPLRWPTVALAATAFSTVLTSFWLLAVLFFVLRR